MCWQNVHFELMTKKRRDKITDNMALNRCVMNEAPD